MTTAKGQYSGKLRELKGKFTVLGSQEGQTPNSKKLLQVAEGAKAFIENNPLIGLNDPTLSEALFLNFEARSIVDETQERKRLP